MTGGYGKIRGSDNTNGFQKNPQNINRKGRPRNYSLREGMRKAIAADGKLIVENVHEVDERGKKTGNKFKKGLIKIPTGDMINKAQIEQAAKGDVRSAEYVRKQIDGSIPQVHILEYDNFKIDLFTDAQIEIVEYILRVGMGKEQNDIEKFNKIVNKYNAP